MLNYSQQPNSWRNTTASAPLSPAVFEHFESTIGINIVESYGMAEAASQICANPVDGPRKPGSVGPPVGVELRITRNDDGYLFIVGRSDDVINRGGEKIFPREIEEVVERVKGILEASVVGVPDEVFGHVPVLFITLDETVEDRSAATFEAIAREVCDLIVANFARTRRPISVNVVDAMLAHAIGKVQKRELASGTVPVPFTLLVK